MEDSSVQLANQLHIANFFAMQSIVAKIHGVSTLCSRNGTSGNVITKNHLAL
jgi:hypothetical protein